VLDQVNRSDGFSSFHTKQTSNVNVVQVVLLDANSTWPTEMDCDQTAMGLPRMQDLLYLNNFGKMWVEEEY
jgi:hypothetical protein